METNSAAMFKSRTKVSSRWCRGLIVIASLALAGVAPAQPVPLDHAAHQHAATEPSPEALINQIQELKAKVAQLDAINRQANPTAAMGQMGPGSGMAGMPPSAMAGMPAAVSPRAPAPMPGMGGGPAADANPMSSMMQEMGSMMQMMGGMMGSMKPGGAEMGGMKPGEAQMGTMKMEGPAHGMAGMAGGSPPQMGNSATGGMSAMGGMEKMGGMMGMPPGGSGMAPMGTAGPMIAALPGFPGSSHLYHIGGTGFFLDHAAHISLTVAQQVALNAVKEKALLGKAANQRKVDAAEQELWSLTASDQPDATQIEAKLREVEKFRGDERLDFIRAVGESAKLLTDGQRQSLLGLQPPQPATAAPKAAGQM